ncbi:hypothetical protein SELMODRAFT_443424 [Selaginella moellendorffii]|uniref:Uncharacterized protein ABI5C-2 n=1 Tax=Selaginella moellendorffii TaxID=88036 RepID=D8S186_SELML|nr:bZIP transcription factor 46 isoform X2 [Selaginella moellendorffii]EFJ21671.1 hypothetical protein SELMODRAFT_443424 [Selaginella moellendorffii]|eukprot:XP_002977062.1 bZIP transcription factor 46 isoform X2 [Selaginella moellendorffii]
MAASGGGGSLPQQFGAANGVLGRSNSLLGGRLGSMALPRQQSIYSLTLDEFQSSLGEPGKNFGSMNMDDLLKNIWTAEESQAMAAALFSSNDPSSSSAGAVVAAEDPSLLPRQPSLGIQRQNSLTLLPLPQSLSAKTVDEVWKDIGPLDGYGTAGDAAVPPMKPRQGTYGEMTLEDFLVKAGVMAPDAIDHAQAGYYPTTSTATANGSYGKVTRDAAAVPGGGTPILGGMTGLLPGKKEPVEVNDPMLGIGLGPARNNLSSPNGFYAASSAAAQAAKHQAEWIESQYKNSTALAQQQQQQQQLMQLAAYNGNAAVSTGLGMGLNGGTAGGVVCIKETSPGSPLSDALDQNGGYGGLSNYGGGFDGPLRGRKRILDAPLEKIVERRQRRMIKNRESAARSRARKQAYTVELEAEVTQLKEENMKLRKMQEEENIKRKKQQALEVITPMTQHLPKMLKRTLTGPW